MQGHVQAIANLYLEESEIAPFHAELRCCYVCRVAVAHQRPE
jgi:hypothetical protein